jgi:hypothetical protein
MNRIDHLNLIHLFDFYLAAMFVLGTYRRFEQYRAVAGLALSMPGRWPRLFQLVKQHRTIFLTWNTILPSVLTLTVWAANTLASRLIWHRASLTGIELLSHWQAWLIVLPLGAAMLAVDVYFLIRVGAIDRSESEKYFAQAEHWLSSWQAPAVRFLTLGFVNPRRMVHDEVRKALIAASDLINRGLYWTSVQMGLRIAFGLGLWFTWAVWGGS